MSTCARTCPSTRCRDFRLITQIVSVPEILVVNENVPAKTLAELVALAKAQPGKMVFASTGLGGMPHLATELLKITAQIELVHVPYTGAAPAVNDLLGGHVQMMFADMPGAARRRAVGQAARAGHRQPHAQPEPARRADHGRARHAPGRGRQLVRPGGGGRARPRPSSPSSTPPPSRRCSSRRGEGEIPGPGRASPSATRRDEFTAYVKSEIDRWGKVIADGRHQDQVSLEQGQEVAASATHCVRNSGFPSIARSDSEGRPETAGSPLRTKSERTHVAEVWARRGKQSWHRVSSPMLLTLSRRIPSRLPPFNARGA